MARPDHPGGAWPRAAFRARGPRQKPLHIYATAYLSSATAYLSSACAHVGYPTPLPSMLHARCSDAGTPATGSAGTTHARRSCRCMRKHRQERRRHAYWLAAFRPPSYMWRMGIGALEDPVPQTIKVRTGYAAQLRAGRNAFAVFLALLAVAPVALHL